MRLSILDNGHRRRAKLFLTATSAMSRVDSPDIVKMLLYRPDFLTRELLELTAPAMRGPSFWTAGEREYLAMCTAEWHECPFCVVTHAEMIRLAGHGEIDPDQPASARPELRRIREFLHTVTLTPDQAGSADGVPGQAAEEALRVNLVWNIVNRLANAFGFHLRDGQLESGTKALNRVKYRFPGFLLAGGEHTDHGDPAANLRHAVLDAPARTDPALRSAAATGAPMPEPWQSYTATVRDASHRITDSDVDRLTAEHPEDEIFELTTAAAVGAALRSFDAGHKALQREESP
jgi:hypothetical protein